MQRLGNSVPVEPAWEIAQSLFGYLDGKKAQN